MKKRQILKAENIVPYFKGFEVIGAFNPAVAKCGGKTVMLVRVAERPVQKDENYFLVPEYDERSGLNIIRLDKSSGKYDFSDCRVVKNSHKNYLTSLSYFLIAESEDGLDFRITDRRILPEGPDEEYGIEDPRITEIDGVYYITYSAISDCGINTKLMVTSDFQTFERKGVIFYADNKDVVIFPHKIGDKYYALHRPSTSQFAKPEMWIAESPDLRHWGGYRVLLRSDEDGNERVGAGAVPVLTKEGWLEIFHAADENNCYKLYAMIMNKDDPEKIEARGTVPLIEVTEDFEKNGFFKNVVFTCGMIAEGEKVRIYYGTCDTNVAMAELSLGEIYENVR